MLSEPNISYKPFWGICRPLNSWRANSPNPIQIYCAYIRQDDKASEQITEYICKNLSGLDWTHDRGTLTTEFYPLHVVDEQKIPAILFEAGFSTNTKEIQKLKNSTNQKKVAQAIAKAFNKYITENK